MIEKVCGYSEKIYNIIMIIYFFVYLSIILSLLIFDTENKSKAMVFILFFLYFTSLAILYFIKVKNSKIILIIAYIPLFFLLIFIKLSNYITPYLPKILVACALFSFLGSFFSKVIKNTDSPSEKDKLLERICDGIALCAMGVSLYATMASSFETQNKILQTQLDMSSLKNRVETLENVTRTSPVRTPSVCSAQMAQLGRCHNDNATVHVPLTAYIPSATVSSARFHQTLSNEPSMGGR